jgi:BirA family biotin operon repressor/biotin-[acetyl-CoA-carboxylase] ligase
VGRVALPTVDSTNAEGLRRGVAPCWVLAGQQTAGRGRRARPWASPPGNFHATLVLRPAGPPAEAALRSFAAALALHDALARLTGAGEALALKWPNDVLLAGGKVAGILLESMTSGGRVDLLAVGVGVNLIAHPAPGEVEEGALPPTSVLAATGYRIAPGQLLDHLAPAFATWEERLATRGFAPLREAWLARAARLGQPIRARTGTATHHGVFETIDPEGRLILATPAGPLAIPAAEVFF